MNITRRCDRIDSIILIKREKTFETEEILSLKEKEFSKILSNLLIS